MMFFRFFVFVALFATLLLFPKSIFAEDNNQFITIVNPVRISKYTSSPSESLSSQYEVIEENGLSATWLLTFDALENEEIISAINNMDEDQEFGIFLEVTKNFTEKVDVEYRDTGHWHHAGSVFLSGYTQEERKILIDKVFEKYKEIFNKYPASVGSWWTDSFSLSYMKEKYGITANLICADQFSMDNYQLWGQPWILPYYPSKFHAGVPAQEKSNKLDVVSIQWAARDPLNGYYSSLYSTQDYLLAPQPQTIEYLERLVDLYTNSFSQITIGLESDMDPSGYKKEFRKQIELVKSKQEKDEIVAVSMKDFSDWYREEFPNLPPNTLIESADLLGSKVKAYWYQGPKYRLLYTEKDGQFTIRDLRIYPQDLVEPYYGSPNRDIKLSINIPSIFDEINNPDNIWKLPSGVEIITGPEKILIKAKGLSIPKRLKVFTPFVKVKRGWDYIEISFKEKMGIPKEGVVIKDYSSEAIHFFKQKKAFLYLLTGKGWNYLKKIKFTIPQEEVYALLYLSSLAEGRVMVYDNECLQCSWHTKYKPPAFANSRKYIRKYSKHPTTKNSSVFNAETREEAKRALERINAQYVYLVKHEDYFEKLPFSPGDLGVEKIFENANAVIWEVK